MAKWLPARKAEGSVKTDYGEGAERAASFGSVPDDEPGMPTPPAEPHVPPIEEPPDNPDLEPHAPVREPEPTGPKRL